MGIEAIGSIASGVGKAGSSLANFGEVMKASIGNIINEGPARGGFLGGEILFQVKPSVVPNVIQQAESVAAAAWEKSALSVVPEPKVVNVEPIILSRVGPLRAPEIVEFPKPRIINSPAVELQPAIVTKTETRAENKVSVLPQPAQKEQEEEEIVEEKVEKQEPEEKLEEEEIVERQMYLEDENASAQRRIEIREAVVKARTEADRLGLKKIAGWLVAKFLPGEHEGNRSQVVKKTGPDGSYQETVETIAGAGELESEAQAAARFDKVVAEKKPVKFGKNGTPVEERDIRRVLKYLLFKPTKPIEEIRKRIIKKKVVTPPQSVTVKPELNINDFPALAEACLAGRQVFPKAA